MKRRILLNAAMCLALLYPAGAATAAEQAVSIAAGACTKNERWSYGAAIPRQVQQDVNSFLAGAAHASRAFSEGLALRKFARSAESRLLGEYVISRALYEAGMVHAAFTGFGLVAARIPSEGTDGVQRAALECMGRISAKLPSLRISPRLVARMGEHGRSSEIIRELALRYLRQALAAGRSEAELEAVFASFVSDPARLAFARALLAARKNDHAAVISQLEKIVPTTAPLNGALSHAPRGVHGDHARILLARAYYKAGRYAQGIRQLKAVSRGSNDFAGALSELSWHQLMYDRPGDAIGTAVSMQSGGFRKTFTPEPLMVMAMALNELCQYPDSLKAISAFKHNYEKPYRWLKDSSAGMNYYKETIKFLKRESRVPERIGSEWLRSPVFIANQEEINLIIVERGASLGLGRAGGREQKRIASEARQIAAVLKTRIREARIKARPGAGLPDDIRSTLGRLKALVIAHQRMQSAAPVWRAILGAQERQAPVLEAGLIAGVNSDISVRNKRMLALLDDIAENNQLIEVEIFNGASQDIIWQNAHPDYKALARKMTKANQDSSEGKVWDWGLTNMLGDEEGEIWEDELGSFGANMFDNCSSKERYLALRR